MASQITLPGSVSRQSSRSSSCSNFSEVSNIDIEEETGARGNHECDDNIMDLTKIPTISSLYGKETISELFSAVHVHNHEQMQLQKGRKYSLINNESSTTDIEGASTKNTQQAEELKSRKTSLLQLPSLLALGSFASGTITRELTRTQASFSSSNELFINRSRSDTMASESIMNASRSTVDGIGRAENEAVSGQRRERKDIEHKPRASGWKTLPDKFFQRNSQQQKSRWKKLVKESNRLKEIENVTIDDPKIDQVFAEYEWPFENMVFEGGGHKTMAYVGAMKVLEKAGIMKNIKRVSGAGAGAITATLVAIGYDAEDLRDFCEEDTRKILLDHKCGLFSLVPNLFKGYGWNPGNQLLKWFGGKLEEVTGNPDITFKQIHQMFDCELCVIVTNLNHLCTEYFHPKTTPNTPVRKAVRMSCAIPGVYQAVRVKNSEFEDVYVDGGLLCNYPIHTYDGWWLSMTNDDSFFKKLQPLESLAKLFEKSERFGTWNDRTLGLLLYSDRESEQMKRRLREREGCNCPRPPNSKLARLRYKQRQKREETLKEHTALVNAVGKLLKEIHESNVDQDEVISRAEFEKVFKNPVAMTQKDFELVFGDGVDCQAAFNILDTDNSDEITFEEMMNFVESKGVQLQSRFLGYQRKEIKNFGDFLGTLKAALVVNVKRMYVEERDVERTIGIDTDYIETTDFNITQMDKLFLVESGARGTRAFLKEYIKSNSPPMKRASSTCLSAKTSQTFVSVGTNSSSSQSGSNNQLI